jgi:hypothetical protein
MSSVKLKFLQMYEEIELSKELIKQLDITKHNQANQHYMIRDLHGLVPHEKPGEKLIEFRNIPINTITSGKCSK